MSELSDELGIVSISFHDNPDGYICVLAMDIKGGASITDDVKFHVFVPRMDNEEIELIKKAAIERAREIVASISWP